MFLSRQRPTSGVIGLLLMAGGNITNYTGYTA